MYVPAIVTCHGTVAYFCQHGYVVVIHKFMFLNFRRDFTIKYILPEIEELLKDEEVNIRSAAISALCDINFIIQSGKLLLSTMQCQN